MDFEPYFKVHNLISVHRKSIVLDQMINLNMIFHVVVSVYWLVKTWNSPQFNNEFRNGQFALIALQEDLPIDLVTSDIVRDSFVGSETVPILFKHDVNTEPVFLEVITPKQPDYKRLREYVFDRLKIELNDSQGRSILFQGNETSVTLHFRKKITRREKKNI